MKLLKMESSYKWLKSAVVAVLLMASIMPLASNGYIVVRVGPGWGYHYGYGYHPYYYHYHYYHYYHYHYYHYYHYHY